MLRFPSQVSFVFSSTILNMKNYILYFLCTTYSRKDACPGNLISDSVHMLPLWSQLDFDCKLYIWKELAMVTAGAKMPGLHPSASKIAQFAGQLNLFVGQ